jgi:hypothetical protein
VTTIFRGKKVELAGLEPVSPTADLLFKHESGMKTHEIDRWPVTPTAIGVGVPDPARTLVCDACIGRVSPVGMCVNRIHTLPLQCQ